LETRESELQKTTTELTTELKQHKSKLQENIAENTSFNLEDISSNDILIPHPNMTINNNQKENEMHVQVELSSKNINFRY
jgi:regulator of replication initiation timing